MFGIGGFELFLILLFGFLIFGPDKLPAIAKTVGQAINKFRNAQEEMTKVIQTEVYDPHAEDPLKKPLDALTKLGESMQSGDAAAKKPAEASAVKASGAAEKKAESFSERKARYDRERAAQKNAQAPSAKPAEGPAKKDAGATQGSDVIVAGAAAKPVTDVSEEPTDAKVTDPGARPSADELYGNRPKTEAARPKAGAAPVPEQEEEEA